MIRTLAAALAASTCIVALATPAAAQGQEQEFNIPAGSLKSALDAYVRQSGRQIVYRGDEVRSARSPGVRGSMSPDAALATLLAGSGFTTRIDGKLVAIVKAGNGDAANAVASLGQESDGQDGRGISEILVVGSRSQNLDIRRSEDDSQPYVVFDAEEIQRSGASDLDSFFQSRLAQNAANAVPAQSGASNTGKIDLRGFGTNQTLILIDGRRVAGAPFVDSFDQPAIGSIPLSAIERVEVLPAAAGGIHGGGATGGVVNIILKRNYSGLSLNASYGQSFRGDGGNWKMGGFYGFGLESGRTHVDLAFQYSRDRGLDFNERNGLVRASRDLTFANSSFISPPGGATPNICAAASATSTNCGTSNLTLDLGLGGASLGSPITSLPAGYAGFSSDQGAALVANAGRYNLDMTTPSSPLWQEDERIFGSVNIRREMTDYLDAYVSFRGEWADRSQTQGDEDTRINLPADSPYNPFQQAIVVNISGLLPELDAPNIYKTRTLNGGLIFRFPKQWSGSLDFTQSRIEDGRGNSFALGPNPAALDTVQANALIDPHLFPDSGRENLFVVQSVGNTSPDTVHLTDFNLRIGGPLFELPGGKVKFSGLLARRTEKRDDRFQVLTGLSTTNFDTLYYYVNPASQRVYSAYGEVTLPVVGSGNALPFAKEFELTGAVRYDHYRTRGLSEYFTNGFTTPTAPDLEFASTDLSSTDYTITARFKPIDDLTFRGSYGTGFFVAGPGSFVQRQSIYNSPVLVSGLNDPRRNNMTLNIPLTVNFGGNPNLGPEKSDSLTFGVILEPRFLKGLRVSADYVRIKKRDEISSPGFQFLIDNENLYPDRIVRGVVDIPGLPGPIIEIDSSTINLAATKVEAIDIQADFKRDIGSLGLIHFYSGFTYTVSAAQQVTSDLPFIERLGYNDAPLKWRGNAGVDWTIGSFQLASNVQYFGSTSLCASSFSEQSCEDLRIIPNGGRKNVPGQAYVDLSATYHFGPDASSAFRNLDVTIAISNLFDEQPTVLAASNRGFASYSRYGDPRLRRFQLSVTKSF